MSKIKRSLSLEEPENTFDCSEEPQIQPWVQPTGVLDFLVDAAKRREVFFDHMSKAHVKTIHTATRYK